MPQSFSISTQPIWSQQLATAVDTASCALIPALLLMERAGAAIHAQALQHGAAEHKIIILVGSGNNGGECVGGGTFVAALPARGGVAHRQATQ